MLPMQLQLSTMAVKSVNWKIAIEIHLMNIKTCAITIK